MTGLLMDPVPDNVAIGLGHGDACARAEDGMVWLDCTTLLCPPEARKIAAILGELADVADRQAARHPQPPPEAAHEPQ